MKFRINSLKELTEKEQNFVRETCILGDPVLDSYILQQKFFEKNMAGMLGKSKQKIWDDWHKGADGPGREPDGFLDLDIVGFWDSSRTIGGVSLWGKIQRINRKILGTMRHKELFRHLVHESFHKIGFYHKSFLWGRRDVAYRGGEAAEEAFKEYYKLDNIKISPSTLVENIEKNSLVDDGLRNFAMA